MFEMLAKAAGGMAIHQERLRALAENLANVNTLGYKRRDTLLSPGFADVLARLEGAGQEGPRGDGGTGAGSTGGAGSGNGRVFAAGPFLATWGELDLAIEGDGFFVVDDGEGGAAYTRAGAFARDGAGNLVTPEGRRLVLTGVPPEGLPAGTLRISADGEIMLESAGAGARPVGKIALARFERPEELRSDGGSIFSAVTDGDASTVAPVMGRPGVDGLGVLRQGYLEQSNVDMIEALTGLVITQRAFELAGRAAQNADLMLALANNIRK